MTDLEPVVALVLRFTPPQLTLGWSSAIQNLERSTETSRKPSPETVIELAEGAVCFFAFAPEPS